VWLDDLNGWRRRIGLFSRSQTPAPAET